MADLQPQTTKCCCYSSEQSSSLYRQRCPRTLDNQLPWGETAGISSPTAACRSCLYKSVDRKVPHRCTTLEMFPARKSHDSLPVGHCQAATLLSLPPTGQWRYLRGPH